MKKNFFAAKRGNVFRRKSDGVVIGRFVIDTTIDGYEEVIDENPRPRREHRRRPMSPKERFLERRRK